MSIDGRTDLVATRDEQRGTKMDDVWDLPYLHSQAKERMGYATQKPLALLEGSSEGLGEGDVVFDPFCGCATTLEAAHRLGRQWIGIEAIRAAKRVAHVRLGDRCGLVEGTDYVVEGVPRKIHGGCR